MENQYVTIITPTLNSEATIEACLKSVAEQTFTDFEHLIIDGLSSDKTIDIVKSYQNRFGHIRLISERDLGIYDAMNKGIKMSSGKWIYFLGSDDQLFDSSVLKKVFTGKINDYHVIYGNVIFKNSQKIYDFEFNWYKLINRNICHQGIFFRKEIFTKLGLFNLKYKMLADWEYNIRWFNTNSVRKKYLNLIIARYNENGLSFKIPDIEFKYDFNNIVKSNLPFYKYYLWAHKKSVITKKILSVLYL